LAQNCADTATWQKENLGTVSFVSDREWTVGGNGIIQIWSDAVQATGCNKTEFRGDSASYTLRLTDCRSNPGQRGNFFTWCAIVRFASDLCPAPWRVPTAEDFCDLDKILSGHATCNSHVTSPDEMAEIYIGKWGGSLGGASGSWGTLYYQDVRAYYWSVSEYNEDYAFYLTYDVHGNVQSQSTNSTKAFGASLRCVK
jgi:uncharacterized protein (TIGR02145 family)